MNPLERARLSLEGLSVGDAFGERFFVEDAITRIRMRAWPPAPWPYTDDTEMALGIVDVLAAKGDLDQDLLAETFARRYAARPWRGYGGAAHQILAEIGAGIPWRSAARRVFGGEGSCGNGGAMRVAPLGAYFAADLGLAAEKARLSAEVTHAHPEGKAGAIAIAVAAAHAWQMRERTEEGKRTLFDAVLAHVPPGEVRDGIAKASRFSGEALAASAALELGSGERVTAQDTVPFTLWCAARHLDSYEEAIWTTLEGLGDRDTTCAIVGGIVALSAGRSSVPEGWITTREPLK